MLPIAVYSFIFPSITSLAFFYFCPYSTLQLDQPSSNKFHVTTPPKTFCGSLLPQSTVYSSNLLSLPFSTISPQAPPLPLNPVSSLFRCFILFPSLELLRLFIHLTLFFNSSLPVRPTHFWDAFQPKAHTLTWGDVKEHQDPGEHWNRNTPTRGLLGCCCRDLILAISFQTAKVKRERWNVYSSCFFCFF